MITLLAPTTAHTASGITPLREDETRSGPRGRATRRTVSVLGVIVALAGIEHGIGEILQGSVAPQGIAILSWPDSAAFRVLAGEPAITVVPNLLATGVLAILVSLIFLACATLFIGHRHGGFVLMVMAIVLLLLGGGIGPPFIGLVLGLVATRIHRPVHRWPSELSGGLPRTLANAWSWLLGLDVAAWLAVFPGVVVIALLLGPDAVPEAIAYIIMLAAFVLLPLSLVAALAADA